MIGRRWMSLFAAGLLVAAAACGDAGEQGDEAQETTANIGGSIEVAAVWSGAEQKSFQKVLDEFETRTGTKSTFTSTGDKIATVLRTRITGGEPPEVAVLPQPGLLVDLAEQKALKSIEEVVGDQVDASWAPDWRELGSHDGMLHGVFFKGANKSTVWYNVPAFEEAEVEPPQTWDELTEAAQTLRDSGIPPFAIGGGAGWVLTDWFENIYLRSAGAEKYDELTRHEIPWTDPSVKTALTTFGEILGGDGFVYQGPTKLTFEESVDAVLADEPKAAMVFEGDFVPGATDIAKGAEAGTGYDFFEFPSIDGSQPAVVGGGDVAVMLKDTPQSRALLEFLATTDAAEIWAEQGGFASPNKDVDAGAYPNEIAGRTATSLAEAETFRFDLSDLVPTELGGDVPGSMWGILQDFAENPSDVDGTAAKLEAAAKKAFA
jgi:alpha-glucoside transport system substrate-binding protein